MPIFLRSRHPQGLESAKLVIFMEAAALMALRSCAASVPSRVQEEFERLIFPPEYGPEAEAKIESLNQAMMAIQQLLAGSAATQLEWSRLWLAAIDVQLYDPIQLGLISSGFMDALIAFSDFLRKSGCR
jgi:hypothetical protein